MVTAGNAFVLFLRNPEVFQGQMGYIVNVPGNLQRSDDRTTSLSIFETLKLMTAMIQNNVCNTANAAATGHPMNKTLTYLNSFV